MLKCQCRLFHISAGDESDWEAWARSPFSTDPGGRAEPPQPRHDARDAAAAAREVEDDASAARERRRHTCK